MARLFLSGDWQSTMGGRAHGFALLFPMNDLFEAYIGRKLHQALASTWVRLQDRQHDALRHSAGGGGAFALRPDIIVETANGPLVIDTKWKRLDPNDGANHGVSQSDVYQMLAYAHAYDAHRSILLYPWDRNLESLGVVQRWTVAASNRVLEAGAVDVGNPSSVINQLRTLVALS